jgi:hypothetical protein
MAADGKSSTQQKQEGRYDWGKMWATDARANLSVDSNVLTYRAVRPPVGDNESDVWGSCGLALIELHESNPTSYRLKPKILKG